MAKRNVNASDATVQLHELEIAINDLDSPAAQENVRAALKDLPGVRSVFFSRGGLMISYNPLGISKKAIYDAITRAGFTVDGMEESVPAPPGRE